MRARLLLFLAVTFLTASACDGPRDCSGSMCLLEAFPAIGPTVLEGGETGVALLAGVASVDPQDVPLLEIGPLTPEQEALIGCGPYWGTDCQRDGIDLSNVEASALQPSGILASLIAGTSGIALPGARSPYLLPPDGILVLDPLAMPPQQQFTSEMAFVSFNLQLLLVALSNQGTGAKDEFDPSNPFAKYDPDDPSTYPFQGQCSFLQPQYCSAIQSVFDIVETPDGFVFLPGTPLPGTIGFEDTEPRCSFTHPHLCESIQQHLRQVRSQRRAALRGCADEEAADERRRGRCAGG